MDDPFGSSGFGRALPADNPPLCWMRCW